MAGAADVETLRFLVNPVYHGHLSKTRSEPTPGPKDRRCKYRKRISRLHQAMMAGEAPEAGLKAAHDAFVASAIRYVRLEDARNLVQDDLAGVAEHRGPSEPPPPLDVSRATAEAFGRAPSAPTMDDFVVRTSSSPPLAPPRRRRRRAKKSAQIVDAAHAAANPEAAAAMQPPRARRRKKEGKGKHQVPGEE